MHAVLCVEMCVLLGDGVYHSIFCHIILQADGIWVFLVCEDKCNVLLLYLDISVSLI